MVLVKCLGTLLCIFGVVFTGERLSLVCHVVVGHVYPTACSRDNLPTAAVAVSWLTKQSVCHVPIVTQLGVQFNA